LLIEVDGMLTKREESILKFVIEEYVATGMPVSSEVIARKYSLGVSPATIRNEMAHLREEDYIAQPHPSAGRIPLEKGYRYYIETLMEGIELAQEEQLLIRHQLYQLERGVEQWLRLGVTILSQMVHNIAIVIPPKAAETRLKHIELASLQEFFALLIILLRDARVRQQVLALDQAMSQEELSVIAKKLTAAFSGLSGTQISAMSLELSPIEQKVVEAVTRMMEAEHEQGYEEPHIAGLRYILGQPEFASLDKVRGIMEVFEERSLLQSLLPPLSAEEGLRVIIGRENREEAMQDFSLVLGRYGLPDEITGTLGVVGPIRMHYERTISAVRFLSVTMSELLEMVYQ
jgi:heat-inducible transcriptional repressor